MNVIILTYPIQQMNAYNHATPDSFNILSKLKYVFVAINVIISLLAAVNPTASVRDL